MQYRPLGQSGIMASAVGLGAWAIGGWPWGGTNEDDAIAALRTAIDAGINLIDSAPGYGLGLSEEIVGKAIVGRRDEVVLATKCGLEWHKPVGDSWFDEMGTRVYRHLGPDSVRHELELSLRRMGTDHLDLYQTHWPDPDTPIADTMGTLLDLKQEGKIRAIGASNVNPALMDEYRALGALDVDQERFNMIDRGLAAEQLPYCLKHNIAVLAYSPIAQGLLTGAIGPDRTFNEGDLRIGNPRYSVENRQRVASLLDDLRPIADGRSLMLSQLVIAWTIAQPGLTHALVGARNPAQVEENAVPGDIVLASDEIAAINAALARHTDIV
jgi:aryl-alcohol dehydrogenase-like predicted oxidoreductase